MSVHFTVQDHVARVTLDRPERLNAVDQATEAELIRIWEAIEHDREVRVVVLTGTGPRAFCTGADMKGGSGSSGLEYWAAPRPGGFGGISLRETLDVPVIARVNGHALGAGLEVAAACDLRIASAQSRFGMPEVRVGIPSVIEAALLPGLIGWGRTRRLLLTAETIEAAQAEQWGLVDWCVPEAQLDPAVEELIEAILVCGPAAIRLQKALIREWEDLPLSKAIERGIASFASAYESDEPRRMAGAFLAAAAARRARRSQ